MLENRKKFIGVFDSGFGGVNILREIVRALPAYDYLYMGDTARTPYGTRSQDVVYEFTRQAVDFMFAQGCELIILACNTASSDALHKIQQEYLPKRYPDKKVLGVLIPSAEEAIAKTINGKVGVIATEATVRSNAFVRELTKLNANIKVFQNASPLLVPIVEEGEHKSELTQIVLEKYLTPLKNKGVDTIILGCTHYSVLERQIMQVVGSDVILISSEEVVPRKLQNYLIRHQEISSKLTQGGEIQFYSTDLTDRFMLLGSEFFGIDIKVTRVSLE